MFMLGVSQKPRCVTWKTEANPDHFVLYVDTNDLDSDRSPDLIAKSIVDAVSSLIKSHKHDVTISNITQNGRFISKLSKVNTYMLDWILFRKNIFNLPFQYVKIAALEWQ